MSEAFVDQAQDSFIERYWALDDRSRRLFSQVIQDLQSHCYVLRGGAIRTNPHYAFLEKHEELVAAYLALGGWRLHLDREQGVARLFHPEGSSRVHFNKDETTLCLVLRLLYHEQKQTSSESPDVVVTVGTIREKLLSLLPAASARPFLSRKMMGVKLRRLESFRVISFPESSFQVDDETPVTLEPVLEHLITAQSTEGTLEKLRLLFPAIGAESVAGDHQPEEEGEL